MGGCGNVRGVEALLEVSVADALARDVTSRGVTRGAECQYYHREETEGSHHAAITARNPLHMVVCPLTAKWSAPHIFCFTEMPWCLFVHLNTLHGYCRKNCQCEKVIVSLLFVFLIYPLLSVVSPQLTVGISWATVNSPTGRGGTKPGPVCACAGRNALGRARWGSEQTLDQS